ncbi:MAG: hypothetical protein U0X73_15000 [Thermoanaerobaculia bacterium]
MRPRTAALTLAVVVIFAASSCASGSRRQPLPPAELEPAPKLKLPLAPEVPEIPGLLDLHGEVPARYTPGALDRAANVQERLQVLLLALASVARRPAPLELLVLSPEDWTAGGFSRPYGLPETRGAAVIAVAAWGDASTVALAKELLGEPLPALGGSPLRGTEDEAASLVFSDALVEVEAARRFLALEGATWSEPWIGEVLAHLAARVGFEHGEAGRMPAIATLFDRAGARHAGPAAHHLEDWRAGLPLAEDLWYQALFLRGADLLFVRAGDRGSRRFLVRHLKEGRPFTRGDLEELAPALAAWRTSSFAP